MADVVPQPSTSHTQNEPHSSVQAETAASPIEQFEVQDASSNTVFSDQMPSLPPVDGGLAAWRLLLAAFVFEALLWGFPLSFGIFQEYYASQPAFQNNSFVAAIGTTASGISYLGAPLISPVIRRYAAYRTHMILFGWPLCILGLVAGSYANTVGTLLLTQGVMYGVGFVIFYYPILSMVDEFWIHRRGMAYGLLCSASGASGAIVPIAMQASLRSYGHHTTLRGVAVALIVLTGPLIPLLKGRLPAQALRAPASLRTDWTFLRRPLFWTYSLSNICNGLGFFFPALYLPSYATRAGISSSTAALLLTIMSIAQVAGQFTFGYLSDKKTIPLNVLLAACCIVAAVATLALWGLASTLAPLAVFAVLYGFFAAGYTAMWARMVTAVSEEPSASQSMFGLFCAGKGIGNILAGPISAGLLNASTTGGGYGLGTYRIVVVFTGCCLIASVTCLGGVYIRRIVKLLG